MYLEISVSGTYINLSQIFHNNLVSKDIRKKSIKFIYSITLSVNASYSFLLTNGNFSFWKMHSYSDCISSFAQIRFERFQVMMKIFLCKNVYTEKVKKNKKNINR